MYMNNVKLDGSGLSDDLTPSRYINDNGKYESINSYNTFVNYYVCTDPSPTARELSELSGFKVSTCRTWISNNKFIQRKNDFLKEKKNNELKGVRDVNESILSMLAWVKLHHTMLQRDIIIDLQNRTNTLSEMDTLDPERLELLKENSISVKSFNNLVNSLYQLDKYDEYLRDNDDILRQDLALFMEMTEKDRFQNNLKSIHELEKKLENEPW